MTRGGGRSEHPRMTQRARFRQADLVRALKAAVAAGVKPAQVVIEPTGELRLTFDNAASMPAGPENPLDRLLDHAT